MKSTTRLAILAAVLTTSAHADDVILVGGGRLSGTIVERNATTIVLETAPGRVGVPLARVARIVAGNSALDEYRTRRQALAPSDAAGWLGLARWAQSHGLSTQARAAFEQVVQLDPSQAEAQAALGREQVEGRWLTMADAQRARGLVEFEGRWIAPEEHQRLVEERAASAREAREQAESEARIREADARARAAEAEARRAEAEAEATRAAATQVGVPVVLTGTGPFDPFGRACTATPCAPGHMHGQDCGHAAPRQDVPVTSARPSGTAMNGPTRPQRRARTPEKP
jgi:hypothetical protein